ncbi:MAG: carbohydrate ABC transporter permease [Devosia sp.]|uniref:carbohydrate ABC transporter permease n=1 Tax=Devosia sp. TaxID=1871048 RepID=UPI001AC5FDB7|nr:carbohydrate ABC transporter permease [Devosia sp.]MBN9308370.1 carbohydrate ABC transporter permease [Devosia sp.]MBN9314972.1 carbohydrate ABC transporter permease [Devosia sp.]
MAEARRAPTRLPPFLILLLVAATTLYPLSFVVANAFRAKAEYLKAPYGWPANWSLNNFVLLIDNYDVIGAATNSVLVIGCALAISLTASTLAAYAIVKLDLPGRRLFGGTFVSVMLVPSQVLIIPVYLLLSSLRLVDTLPGVVLVYAATNIPFGVFFMTAVMRSVPNDIIEAARIDGAGPMRILVSVVVPVLRTSILTLAILAFLAMWNELIFGLILLPSEANNLLTAKMASIGGRFVTNQPLLMAGLLLTSLPPILVLTFLSKYLVSGIAAGMGK